MSFSFIGLSNWSLFQSADYTWKEPDNPWHSFMCNRKPNNFTSYMNHLFSASCFMYLNSCSADFETESTACLATACLGTLCAKCTEGSCWQTMIYKTKFRPGMLVLKWKLFSCRIWIRVVSMYNSYLYTASHYCRKLLLQCIGQITFRFRINVLNGMGLLARFNYTPTCVCVCV